MTNPVQCPTCEGQGEITLTGSLGERLRLLRQSRGWSLRDAAEGMVGIQYTYVDRLERDLVVRRDANFVKRLKVVARRYGVSLEQLGQASR